MGTEIDFVITWVDGNDTEWKTRKNRAKGILDGDASDSRYREWDTLRYWFRGVEKFAPWVNHVYFVTCGHHPAWLNLDCNKLTLVTHDQFIPDKYLPTFSCRPIEFNLHRIEGLSESFVYFNDDMFLIDSVEPEMFFKNGLPCDTAILDAQSPSAEGQNHERLPLNRVYSSLYYNTAVINRNFIKSESIRQNLGKWFHISYGKACLRTLLLMPWRLFTGFKSGHLPYSYLKSTYEKVWEKENDILDIACSHKFRESNDVSSRLLSFWQIAEGNFQPRSPKLGVQTFINNDMSHNEEVFEMIRKQKYKMLCINDEYSGNDFVKVKKYWKQSFELILPEKSIFER